MPLVLAVSIVAGIATAIGIAAVRLGGASVEARRAEFTGFAAGVLVALCLLRLIPAASALAPDAPACLLAGYALFFLLNRALVVGGPAGPAAAHRRAAVPLAAIALHSLLDGVTLSASFAHGQSTGLMVALGLILHEFPEGVVTYSLLRLAGLRERNAALLALAGAALTTPLGTALSYSVIDRLAPDLLGMVLATSAGALLYVGATHLLPEAERESGLRASAAALAGALLVALAVLAER